MGAGHPERERYDNLIVQPLRKKASKTKANTAEPSAKSALPKESAKAETASAAPRTTRGAGPLVPLDLGRPGLAAGLIDQISPVRTQNELILSAENSKVLTQLVTEYRQRDTFLRHGLAVRSKLLFCGPPGCGKTLTAEVFARELGLDLLVVRLDAVISSFLGETASNLRQVLEAAQKRPTVLFLDEFDALARSRTESSGHGELRRVVNSLLMMIDRFRGPGFLIAATNLQDVLDEAIWRRFDEVILFDPPGAAQIKAMLKLKTRNFPADFEIAAEAGSLAGYSYAEIERVSLEAIRQAILGKRAAISLSDFKSALKSEQRRKKIRQKVVGSKG